MAAGSLLAQLSFGSLFRETSVGYQDAYKAVVYGKDPAKGSVCGYGLTKDISSQLREYYNGIWIVPVGVALGTGLTVRLIITDDGTDASDLGKVVQLEATPYNFSTALSVVDWSLPASKGTATTANVTLATTTGTAVIASIPIVAANLASLATGNVFGLRIRRVGDNAADTCMNRVLLLGGMVIDT